MDVPNRADSSVAEKLKKIIHLSGYNELRFLAVFLIFMERQVVITLATIGANCLDYKEKFNTYHSNTMALAGIALITILPYLNMLNAKNRKHRDLKQWGIIFFAFALKLFGLAYALYYTYRCFAFGSDDFKPRSCSVGVEYVDTRLDNYLFNGNTEFCIAPGHPDMPNSFESSTSREVVYPLFCTAPPLNFAANAYKDDLLTRLIRNPARIFILLTLHACAQIILWVKASVLHDQALREIREVGASMPQGHVDALRAVVPQRSRLQKIARYFIKRQFAIIRVSSLLLLGTRAMDDYSIATLVGMFSLLNLVGLLAVKGVNPGNFPGNILERQRVVHSSGYSGILLYANKLLPRDFTNAYGVSRAFSSISFALINLSALAVIGLGLFFQQDRFSDIVLIRRAFGFAFAGIIAILFSMVNDISGLHLPIDFLDGVHLEAEDYQLGEQPQPAEGRVLSGVI